jgi:tripartite-type tricarboxylate transporter receptor subunit TctC
VPGYDATIWWGIAAPKNTPADILQKLNTEINLGLANPALKSRIAELGDSVFASSREEFARVIAEDTTKWANVIRAAGLKAE